MKKHMILFLATNPINTDRLAIDREARAIHVELSRSGYRDCFELVTRWATEPLDLLRELRQLKPTVVHFSGHHKQNMITASHCIKKTCCCASDTSCALEITEYNGMCFRGADGRAQFVSAAALRLTFDAVGACVKLVVLNTCYSGVGAEAIFPYTDCVIEIQSSIQDDAARNFAIGFYGALAECESVAAAYEQGCAAISLEGTSNSDRPQLWVRDGIDARRIVLAAKHRRNRGKPRPTLVP